MKRFFYVEMKDYRNDIDWMTIGAFSSEEAAKAYAEERTNQTEGRIYVVQSMPIIQ